jgi:hypothetical protein
MALDPLKEEALRLYVVEGWTLRQAAGEVGRSHEWVRKVLLAEGEALRERGRVPIDHAACPVCSTVTKSHESKYCSIRCFRLRHAAQVKEADRLLLLGVSEIEIAQSMGITLRRLETLLSKHGYLPLEDLPPLRIP